MLYNICISTLFCCFYYISYGQNEIEKEIKNNLNSRFTQFGIVSIRHDSCSDIKKLFNLSLVLKIRTSEAKLNILENFAKYENKEIDFKNLSNRCNNILNQMDSLQNIYQKTYFHLSNDCLLVKYWYSDTNGIKTYIEEHYSLDKSRYEKGNYPFLDKKINSTLGSNSYYEVVQYYKKLLLEDIDR